MATQKIKRMTKSNTKGFFEGMEIGEQFTSYFDVFQTVNKGNKAGYGIAVVGGTTPQTYAITRIPHANQNGVRITGKTYPVLRSNNANVFFRDKKVGDEFAFLSYTFEQAKEIAALCGYEIEQCERFKNGEILRIKCKVKNEPPPAENDAEHELKSSYTVAEAALAISIMLSVRLGHDDVESRGAFIIKHALQKTLFAAMVDARSGAPEENFVRSFGMPYEHLRRLAHTVDNIQGDSAGLIAAGLVSTFAEGILQHNYAQLAKCGLQREIPIWCQADSGAIKKIDRIQLSDRTVSVVTVRTREEEDWFASVDDSSIRFAKYEDALLYCLFGEHHYDTVGTLYRAIGH